MRSPETSLPLFSRLSLVLTSVFPDVLTPGREFL
jgi:hypothetical protein